MSDVHWHCRYRETRRKNGKDGFILFYTHCAHTSPCPKYLTDVLKLAAKYYLRPGLRSSPTNNYFLPRLQSRLGERALSYGGPLVLRGTVY